MIYNLETRYDSRKSFYGKARVEEKDNELILWSYNTIVASYNKNTSIFTYYGKYSQTTTRHQREFYKQIKEDYGIKNTIMLEE